MAVFNDKQYNSDLGPIPNALVTNKHSNYNCTLIGILTNKITMI